MCCSPWGRKEWDMTEWLKCASRLEFPQHWSFISFIWDSVVGVGWGWAFPPSQLEGYRVTQLGIFHLPGQLDSAELASSWRLTVLRAEYSGACLKIPFSWPWWKHKGILIWYFLLEPLKLQDVKFTEVWSQPPNTGFPGVWCLRLSHPGPPAICWL